MNHFILFLFFTTSFFAQSYYPLDSKPKSSTSNYTTTYYVSSTGDDGNSGTSEETAWKTLAKVNSSTFSPGDIIAFKRGDTWREQLTIPSNGRSANPISFNSYGSGAKPRILGSEIETSWTNISGNLWQSNKTYTNPATVTSYGVNIFFVETNDNVTWGRVKKTKTEDCVAEYDWTWDSGHIYIYSPTDPNTRYSGVEISQRETGVRLLLKEYVTIDGLEIAYSGFLGIGEPGSEGNVKGLIVKNCHIHHIGRKEIGYGIDLQYSNVLIQNNEIHDSGRRNISFNPIESTDFSNVIVEDNELYNGFHTTGIDISTFSGIISNIIIRRNFIHESLTADIDNVEIFGTSLIYCADDGSGRVSNIYIYDNIFKNNTGLAIGIGASEGPESCYIYNNTFYGVSPHITATYKNMILIKAGSNAVLKNNIFYNDVRIETNPTYSVIGVTPDAGTVTLDHNLYFNTSATRLIVWYGTNYSTSQWETYKSVSGQDSNSIIGENPLFTSSSDYHLKSTSPAINVGVNVGLSTDYDGNSIIGLPDAGALEYNK